MMEGTIALSVLPQNGLSAPVSFLENVFLKLLTGITLAEVIIRETGIGDFIIAGGSTFHFIIYMRWVSISINY
jgi:hypothetical protein